jgi:DnaJ-class molecular chaperone
MAEYVKCNHCKGTGFVPGSGSKRFVKCPICNGRGKKVVRKPQPKRKEE